MAFLPIPYDPPGAPPLLLTAPSWRTSAFQRSSFSPTVPVSLDLQAWHFGLTNDLQRGGVGLSHVRSIAGHPVQA